MVQIGSQPSNMINMYNQQPGPGGPGGSGSRSNDNLRQRVFLNPAGSRAAQLQMQINNLPPQNSNSNAFGQARGSGAGSIGGGQNPANLSASVASNSVARGGSSGQNRQGRAAGSTGPIVPKKKKAPLAAGQRYK
jgi:hypothetical protein